ncbi:elongation factor P--(R)-beta-lysine ligase [Mariniblastus fucicola]|uniref:Elongation factor P--(R)-beta-lysine ligase n=1 Tax=Mariniblastus fucicola TaxID=980251 RepID=A0A5B9PGA0_9BACT|nr:elongation factor P--(R)-beta-lysine ligase [Mariniblastus fucicola]QEG24629.1 Elongation factor P--(R)-beta-lysine ligase [Mariniblastus fucicola]
MSSEEFRFQPTASLAVLRQRSLLLRKIRAFFEDRDFLHVETPLLSRDTVVDRYIDPVRVSESNVIAGGSQDPGHGDANFFLQTSPEFAMKRLLASGATSIFQICKAFRKGESGRRHNPEFTMLEWYRVGDDLLKGIDLLAQFAKFVFDVNQVATITYRDAFVAVVGIDPFSASIEQFAAACEFNGVDTTSFVDDQDRDSWLNLIMSEIVEPKLGVKHPVIVFDWPTSQAALAKIRCDDHVYAERFELYVNGVELANGYHELLDPVELLDRNEWVNQQRLADGIAALPLESQLLEAMRHGLPACSGVALGIDRLLMVLLKKESIGDVIAFPIDRA